MVKVYRPTAESKPVEPVLLAKRPSSYAGSQLAIIDNGKPRARDLLGRLGKKMKRDLGVARVEIYSKPSPAAPIDADVTRMLAARSRLVITGLGD